MLNLCGADWTPRFVDYFQRRDAHPAYREINEMGEAPVLEFGRERLSQSGVILDYLAAKFGRFGWRNDEERREILRWTLFDNHKFTSYIATLRFLMSLQKTGETPVTEFLRGRALNSLGIVDKHLAAQRFLIGDSLTIADVSLCGYLYWPDEFGVSWKDYPNIGRWLDTIAALPGWVHPYKLMPGHPLPEKKG